MMELEDKSHFLVPDPRQRRIRQRTQGHAIQHHLAPRRLVERTEQVEQRALARAAGSDHGDHLAAMHIEINAIQYMNGAAVASDVSLREASRLDDRHS